MSKTQRLINFLITVDQLIFSVITLGSSAPDETMSAAAWRLEQSNKLVGKLFRPLIDGLLFFDPEHCKTSFESEKYKKHLPEIYREE